MSKKTPTKPFVKSNSGFSPITIHTSPAAQSPQKNLTGPPRVIRDIIADLYNNIQSWNSLHIKGCNAVKKIASVKAETSQTYSPQLEEHINELQVVMQSIRKAYDVFSMLEKQAASFSQLPNVPSPVFFSLDASAISRLIKDICEGYKTEFQAKQCVSQNIAHLKSESEAMFLAAYWTHQLAICDTITFKLESLLVESGHRPIQ